MPPPALPLNELPESIWICPPIKTLTPREINTASLLYSSIAKTRTLPAGPAGVAGLELRVALMLLQGGGGFPEADNDFWVAKCNSLFLRPAIEPIACSCWAKLSAFAVDAAAALHIASALAGRRLVYRKRPATGRSVTGDVGFEPIDVAAQWLPKMAAAAATPALLPALPIFCFAQTLMAHPFSDGNGRFARLMVHAALARCAGIARPEIALAPAFYRRARELGSAVTTLSESRDWAPFNAVFLSILEDALVLTKAFRRQRRGRL